MHVIQLVWVTMALCDLQTGASSYSHIPHRMDTCHWLSDVVSNRNMNFLYC